MELTRSRLLNKIRVESVNEGNQKAGMSLLSLALFLIFTFAFFVPSVKSIVDIIEKNRVIDIDIKKTEEVYDSYKMAADYYGEISSNQAEFDKLVPADSQPFDTLQLVTELSIKSNIFLKQASLTNKASGEEEYSLNFSGTYPKVVDFLDSIEESPRFIYLKSLVLDSELGKFLGNIDITANLVTFYAE